MFLNMSHSTAHFQQQKYYQINELMSTRIF